MNKADGLENIRRILVVGAARSGAAAALMIRRVLPDATVAVCDRSREPAPPEQLSALAAAGVELLLGSEDPALIEGTGLVVKSPGVPGDIPLLKEARRRGLPVWGEVELAWRFLENPVIGVTGTNGKTTTTELIGHILREAGWPCRVAGNVGTALSSLVGAVPAGDILVLELSSFQLEDSIRFRPEIAVLLNLSEDHLDRHATAADYFEAKMKVFANQGPDDLAVINRDDAAVRAAMIPGAAARVWFGIEGGPEPQVEPAAGKMHGGVDRRPAVREAGGVIGADLETLAGAGSGVRRRLRKPGAAVTGALVDAASEGVFAAAPGDPGKSVVDSTGSGVKSGASGELSGASGGDLGGNDAGGRDSGRNDAGGGEGFQDRFTGVISWPEAALKGSHNLENSLAAAAVCLAMGMAPGQVAAGLRSFPGVPHRLERVAEIGGVTYVNDSKATNVDAAVKALTAFRGGIHLILGGSLKGCSFDPLARAATPERVRQVIATGQAAPEIAASFRRAGREVLMVDGMEDAVKVAAAAAVSGDVVLLAPACASYDRYDNFERRGEHFISLVREMTQGED